jgi:UDP-N-acetylglucosamine--N-acetylmuramyl-(pentapeptide) pyrophosphoryl-undecaprenol N-acetylglucosamine transferase
MNPKIIFAGGGTAGHVEPALAVATQLRKLKPDYEIIFAGTKKGLENQLSSSGWIFTCIYSQALASTADNSRAHSLAI